MSERSGNPVHPCLRCGACCATFRVSFYWGELASGGGQVPDDLAQRISPHLVAMAGTASHPPRCVALTGCIGQSVQCALYEVRPPPCREFEPSYESGTRNVRCDEARLRHGLAPLTPADWRAPQVPSRPRRIAS